MNLQTLREGDERGPVVAGESIEECKAKLVRTDTGSPTVESCV